MNVGMQRLSIWRSAAAASLAAVLCVAIAVPASAAPDQTAKTVDVATVDIHTWKLDPATGWSVKKLLGKKVKSAQGEDVGEVDNIIFGPDGDLRKLIVSTGGFLGIGEKNLAVKWTDVKLGPGYEYVTTPITHESVQKYGLFDGIPKSSGPLAPREWRSTELIGAYVYLKANVHYAYVRDLIVGKDGQLQAVIVSPDVGYAHGVGGYYAYPFFGSHHHGWHPAHGHYTLPYTTADIADLVPYAYPH